MRNRIAISLLTLWGCFLLHGVVRGQAQRRYQPNSPTVSPYLNLLRTNLGPLPNYHSLVRPQLNQQNFNRGASQVMDYNLRQMTRIENTPLPEQGPIQVRKARTHLSITPAVKSPTVVMLFIQLWVY